MSFALTNRHSDRAPYRSATGVLAIAIIMSHASIQPGAAQPCDTWTPRFPTNMPQPRTNYSLAYDGSRHEILLYGGFGASPLGDTWAWDGADWALRASEGPPTRPAHAMAFDSARSVVVLYCSASSNTNVGQTWEWNGTLWSQAPSFGPPARFGHAMAFDSTRNVTVLFGGALDGQEGFVLDGETWEYAGGDWQFRAGTSDPGPAPRYNHRMVYDSARGVTVLFGGYDGFDASNELWEWNGSMWAQRIAANGPPARTLFGMAYDAAAHATIVFAGGSPPEDAPSRRTWSWNGQTWTRLLATDTSDNRLGCAMAYDSARQRSVLFGGEIFEGENTTLVNDTWELTAGCALGDLDCDGLVNNFDVDPFVLAVSDASAYSTAYPFCNISSADINQDGMVNNFDIDPFVALLTGG